MESLIQIIKAKDKITGKIVSVTYGANRLGNLRMWADGKFYSDKQFDKLFILIESKFI